MIDLHTGKVSIIIPYYNSNEFIKECLDSIFQQSYPNLEIIIINDGSDAENTAYLESLLTDDRIIYVKNEENRGVAFSRNKGLELATGEYVYFLDSDDALTHNAIEVLVHHIQEFPVISGRKKRLVRSSDYVPLPSAKSVDTDDAEADNDDETISDDEFALGTMPEFEDVKIKYKQTFSSRERSILNLLMKREFIEENQIRFYEGTRGYTDISGLVQIFSAIDSLPQIKVRTYYKRTGIAPIMKPALIQRPIEERTIDFIQLYLDLNKKYRKNEQAKNYLDKLLLGFYRRSAIFIFREPNNFEKFFQLIAGALDCFNWQLLASQPRHIRIEFGYLKQKDRNKFRKTMQFHIAAREMRNALKRPATLKRYVYKKAFQFVAKRETDPKLIMFESFLGKQYSDNPRAIYQYLKENYPDYKMYWSIDPRFRSAFPDKGVPLVKRFSLKWLFLMARARFWVTNSRMPLWLPKPENTIYLQTWHGTPLKRLAQDQKEVLMPGTTTDKYKKNFYKESRNWDYLVSPNPYSTEIFRRAFQFDKTIVESGYPRNDVFYRSDLAERAMTFKKKHGLPLNKKVILYAPTWRDNQFHQVGKYKMDLQLDLTKLQQELGSEYIIILRMHYLVAENFELGPYEGFAYDFSNHEDIQDLYIISDLLITDYSSVFFDYANLKRPMIFFTYDIDEYKGDIRGFYFDFEKKAPGPIVKTTEEVIEAVKFLSQGNIPNEKLNEFYQRFCSLEDGHASERVVKEVILKNE
ncbi:CDP-glycerol:glycerophosphate glycerophosphotransferase [Neobacillus sp. YIM B02564]|jgi:CDP-glycerol glycerophosphotransferase|uniref:CDP-glycerol:glycerophosphate glycerophosphotransferase n=1 Tax=Neobacillus paridis TaxID=2803862 RepID=A0ABS1TUR5_9BACI|nr:CDP-glycerol:glycerophosphate glycerophosphotransferase [Neobacillus paridis]MBL4955057.1 CDP-glycerol:glycerophosphate glycerophosphotransferase [Neobacillus paridis]